jgi:plastocyanin
MLLLAACGSATTSDTSTSGSSAAAASGTPVNVSALEYQFTPNTFTVSPGGTVSLSFTNTGTVTHNITAPDLKINQDAAPGATQVITFTAPQSGSFAFHCAYHPTKMTGTITVTGSAPASTSSSSGGASATGGSSSSSSGYGAYP